MSTKLYILTVRGRITAYDFDIRENPDNIEEWKEEGLLIEGPVLNECPQWAQELGLMRIWFWLQDKGVIGV